MSEQSPQRDPQAPAVELIAVRADNPGPMTLSGTNSYVLRDEDQVWVLDPGPKDPEHLAELLLACGDPSRPMGVLLFNFTPGSGSNRDWAPEDHKSFAPSTKVKDDILAYEQKDPHGLSGFLLLLHLGSQRKDKMHVQLAPLLDELTKRGYAFVRVDQMLDVKPSR